ncbi:hypothetical protein [Nocardia amikacinitolerans]|uniref:hypothetical protein n=1 Tax=Nocardia amikacinitolerans TaxID=756689 RepID=UPI0020A2A831|nr:hypothetical protein [Nocardia amikacinitolerans]MCP2274583.1 hypothetical protein [Nocardia amikacinitolerans]MCP2297070.1 hypothetical protein [Nocardia amikacinitolerans]
MRWCLSILSRHLLRGLLLYGASVGGSTRCHSEWVAADTAARRWDWSIPHRWYDAAHR